MGIHALWDRIPYDIKARITNGSLVKLYMSGYRNLMKPIVLHSLKKDTKDVEKQIIASWLKKNPLSIYPYDYTKKYKRDAIDVYSDGEWRYVEFKNHKGSVNKIYAPIGWTENDIKEYFRNLFMEQDKSSPHAYFQDEARMGGQYVADFGGAEGVFALEVIEDAKRVYIFESDEKWVEPLKKTFAPWMEKVEIVRKYIGDIDDENTVMIDTFFKKRQLDCIKADIEGAERALLLGGKISFNHKIKYVYIVGYHKNGDDRMISNVLKKCGFMVSHNKGYMIPWVWPHNFKPPYVRRGVIYGEKK